MKLSLYQKSDLQIVSVKQLQQLGKGLIFKISEKNSYDLVKCTLHYGRFECICPKTICIWTATSKFLGAARSYFVCHISPNFQISLIYVFIGCLQSVIVVIMVMENQNVSRTHPFPLLTQLLQIYDCSLQYFLRLLFFSDDL